MRCGPWKRSLSSSGSSVDRSSPGRRWATTCVPGGDRCKSRPWELGSSPLRPCHTGWSTSTQPCGVSEKVPHSRLGTHGPGLGAPVRNLLGASGPCWETPGRTRWRPDHRATLQLPFHLDAHQPRQLALSGLRFQGRHVFLEFLRPLVRESEGKIFLMVDPEPVHGGHRVQEWLPAVGADGTVLFTPLCPEHNPEEYFHQEILAHARRQGRHHHAAGLKRMVRTYLHRIQQWREK